MIWSLYPTLSAPMPFQMALDESLFRKMESEATDPILRFYFSSEPWITVGYSTRSIPPADSRAGAQICHRITGGGEVTHGEDLIFSLVARKEHDESFRSVRMSYLKIHEALKSAFENLGHAPRFYRCDENLPKGGDCFRFPIATDLAIGANKIAGGAQKRSAGALLHQESVQIPKGLEPLQLAARIRSSLEKRFQIQFREMDLDPAIFEEAPVMASVG